MSFPMKKPAGYAGLFILSLILLFNTEGSAQTRLDFTADKISGQRKGGVRIDYLLGNVVIKQEETTIYADSASVQRKERAAEAFGRVRVLEGDSIDIRARELYYDGQTGTAKLRRNVIYRDGETTLYTDNLDYNKNDGVARYFGGGRMVDGDNTLISTTGIFDKRNQIARFYGKVKLTTPDGTVNSDTLFYNTETKVATFKGPTRIVDKEGNVSNAKEGLVRDTQSETTTILSGKIENEDYIIVGNKLDHDQLNDIFTATGNVVMTTKEDNVVITGGKSIYNRKTGYTYVFDNPVMRRPVENDTLFLSADTLVAIQAEEDIDKRLLAYEGVQIYKTDLQGVADSLVYYFADSTIFFYKNPVLWNAGSQMTGDTISVQMRNNTIDELRLRTNSFVISEDTVKNYNQIKGRQITALFNEGDIRRINVDGNGESIYFVLDEADNSLVGMNRITCGSMVMHFGDNALQHIMFYNEAEGKMVPPHELAEPEKRLTGFNWRGDQRPTRQSVIRRQDSDAAQVNKPATDEAGQGNKQPAAGKGQKLEKPQLQQPKNNSRNK